MCRNFLILILFSLIIASSIARKKLPKKLTVKVINLDRNKDKWAEIQRLWAHSFILERFSAKTHPVDPVCGLALSHIALMRDFAENDANDFLLIMEDDAYSTPEFNTSHFHAILESAMDLPSWQVINFGPWFSRQPVVKPVNDLLVSIDYFHTTHFMGYHRRVIDRYLDTYAAVIEKNYCLAVDNYFGNYGNVKSQSRILASSTLMAFQNHQGRSDIGGGPEMVPCAINAALAGRRVVVKIIDAPAPNIPPTFEPPLYGYYRAPHEGFELENTSNDEWKQSAEMFWSHECNLHGDVVPFDAVLVDEKPVQHKTSSKKKKVKKAKKSKKRSAKRNKAEHVDGSNEL